MATIPVLVGTFGSEKGRKYPLTEQGLRLGRDPGNEIRIDDNGVSRQHARFILHNGAAWVQDVGSRNGIFVNDMRVQAQRQLGVGDSIKVGDHVFEVRLEEAPEEAGAPAAEAPPRRRRRFLPIVIVLVLVGVAVGVIALRGSRTPPKVAVSTPPVADPTADILLDAAPILDVPSTPSTPAGAGTTATPGGLSGITGLTPAAAPAVKIPPPPAGVTWKELVEKGHAYYQSGRLHDALVAYLQAQALYPECELCGIRIEKLNTEVADAIKQHFNAGLVYYNNLQYDQAVNEWETVLLLSPEPDSEVFKETTAYLQQARANVQSQY